MQFVLPKYRRRAEDKGMLDSIQRCAERKKTAERVPVLSAEAEAEGRVLGLPNWTAFATLA